MYIHASRYINMDHACLLDVKPIDKMQEDGTLRTVGFKLVVVMANGDTESLIHLDSVDALNRMAALIIEKQAAGATVLTTVEELYMSVTRG